MAPEGQICQSRKKKSVEEDVRGQEEAQDEVLGFIIVILLCFSKKAADSWALLCFAVVYQFVYVCHASLFP